MYSASNYDPYRVHDKFENINLNMVMHELSNTKNAKYGTNHLSSPNPPVSFIFNT